MKAAQAITAAPIWSSSLLVSCPLSRIAVASDTKKSLGLAGLRSFVGVGFVFVEKPPTVFHCAAATVPKR